MIFTKKRLIPITIIIAAFAITSFAFVRGGSNYFEITKNLELFVNIFKELDALYVDELDADKLFDEGINAMLSSLDPYSTYIPESELADYEQQTTGKYGGIGAIIRNSDDYVMIAEPYEGFPAQRADIRAGDLIVKIAGKSAKGFTTSKVSDFLKGQPGTEVEIELKREGESKPLVKTLKREEIKIQSVPYYGMVSENVGYMLLSSFTKKCSEDLKAAFSDLVNKQGAKSVILDLRGNPGGLLSEAVNVANLFIPRNREVVSTRSKKRKGDKKYLTRYEPVDTNIPLAILLDGGSASAAEIVAGVMQDNDRGILIGGQSFGKGLVQTTKEIGYNSRLKITTSKYYLPSERCIQAIDYAGGYKDGAEKVPDSLRTAFKTENGRTVYDASGIEPDVEIKTSPYGNITAEILRRDLIFEYATIYRSKHPNLQQPEQFELTDKEYDNFTKFLAGKEFDYTSQSEKKLEELRKKAEKENYLPAIEQELKALEENIKHDKTKDLVKYKDEIRQLLEYEIAARYYWQKGRIMEALEDDDDLKKAIEVLNNPNEYNSILAKK